MGQIDQLLRRIAGAPVRTVRRWRSRGISWKVITSNLLPVPSLSIIHHQLLPSRAGNGEGPNFRPTQCYKFISAGFLLSMIAHILDLFARIPFITPRFSKTCPFLPDRRNEQLPLKELRASMKAPWDVNKTFWLCLLLSPSLPSLFLSQE